MRRWSSLLLAGLLGSASAWAGSETDGLDPETVLFSRGEAAITVRDFLAALEEVPLKYRRSAANDASTATRLLSQLLENRLLAVEAEKSGVADDPVTRAAVRAASEKILAREQLEHVIRERLDADVEQMAREYYLAHPGEFEQPPLLTVRHVLVATDQRTEQAALDRAVEVRKLAVEGEREFKALVAEYSDDQSTRESGGLYEEVPADKLVEPFARAARNLEPGGISEPVKTPYGYHVIKLIAKKDRGAKPFETVRGSVMDRIERNQREQVREFYVKELLDRHPLDINKEAIEAMSEQFDARPEGGSGE